VVFFFLPDSPENAKFLSPDEQTEAVERLQVIDQTERSQVSWSQYLSGLTDYKNYVHMAIHFCCNYSFAGLSNFLPTIIQDMGYESVKAQGLTAPPYLASFMCCVGAAFVSDRWGSRGYIISAFAGLGTIGYILLVSVHDEAQTGPRYLGIWLATCGIFPALAINITWLLNNQGGDSKRGSGMAILAILGQCSSFVSSSVFPTSDGPFYVTGCAIGCVLSGAIVVLALGLHFKLAYENRRRDRLYGVVDQHARVDVTDGGDHNPMFRFIT
jgi:nitrate/nitrite transporter NarK